MLASVFLKLKSVIPHQASVMWIAISFMLFFFSLPAPRGNDNPLEITVGTVTDYRYIRGRDFFFTLRINNNQDQQFKLVQRRSSFSGDIEGRIGKEVKIEHYAGLVANCWSGADQFCYSKCNSDAQCTRDLDAGQGWILKLMSIFGFVSYFAIFIWSVYIKD